MLHKEEIEFAVNIELERELPCWMAYWMAI